MSDVGSAWKDAGDRLTALGASLKAHYQEQHGEDGEEAKKELDAATKRFTGAVKDAFDALGAAAKDPAVKDDVNKVGQSLAGALSATFAEVSEDLSRIAHQGRSEVGSAPEASTVSEPGTDTSSDDAQDDEEPPKAETQGTP